MNILLDYLGVIVIVEGSIVRGNRVLIFCFHQGESNPSLNTGSKLKQGS